MTHNFSVCRHLSPVSNKAAASPRAAAEVLQQMCSIGWQRCCQMLPLCSASTAAE